jgi:hypothetical protein
VIGGCSNPPKENTPGGSAATDPFRPVALRIHPLTHIDAARPTNPDKAFIVLHFEMKDRFGDAVKALGTLSVELDKPGAGVTPGMESRELTWDVPQLADPQGNADRFDPPTRTYRVLLSAPRWVAEWAALPAAQRKDAPNWLRLRAVMRLVGEGDKVLDDEYVIQG